MNRSILDAERTNRHLLTRMSHLRNENSQLKKLLAQHGIEYLPEEGEHLSSIHSDTSNEESNPSTNPVQPSTSNEEPISTIATSHPTPPFNYD